MISGIGNVYAAAAGVGALLALESQDRRGDALAAALLVLATVSFTSGAAFAVGALVLIALSPGSRGRIWVAILPIGIYVAWLAGSGWSGCTTTPTCRASTSGMCS